MSEQIFQSTLPVRGATAPRPKSAHYHPISIHAPRAGSDAPLRIAPGSHSISIHAPRAGSDACWRPGHSSATNFNPRSPCGERRRSPPTRAIRSIFQSTLPVRGATPWSPQRSAFRRFQSTLPVRGATLTDVNDALNLIISIHAPRAGSDASAAARREAVLISIHAPRAGSDACNLLFRQPIHHHFNPRSPCGERRCASLGFPWLLHFNPRSPCGERRGGYSPPRSRQHFNPRSPCGERRDYRFRTSVRLISIHAPRAGSDFAASGMLHSVVWISIHAPRAGSDTCPTTGCTRSSHFNPRSPCGERRDRNEVHMEDRRFQSTLPVRGATRSRRKGCKHVRISIHAPRAGSDAARCMDTTTSVISIHAPRAGSDCAQACAGCRRLTFQSTLPVRGATYIACGNSTEAANFNPRSPCGERPFSL